nr:FxDxF family PEP-CTERM protein [uncultured Roseateles sp.]
MNFKKLAVAAALSASAFGAFAGTSSFDADGLAFFGNDPFAGLGAFTQTITFDGLAAGTYAITGDISGTFVALSSVILDGKDWTLTLGAGGKLRGGFVEYTGSKPMTLTVTGLVDAKANTLKQANYQGSIAVSAVPEPETYALMLAGLAAVGFVARRRNAA